MDEVLIKSNWNLAMSMISWIADRDIFCMGSKAVWWGLYAFY